MSSHIGWQNRVGAGVGGHMDLWSQGGTTTVMSVSRPFSAGIFANPSWLLPCCSDFTLVMAGAWKPWSQQGDSPWRQPSATAVLKKRLDDDVLWSRTWAQAWANMNGWSCFLCPLSYNVGFPHLFQSCLGLQASLFDQPSGAGQRGVGQRPLPCSSS